jgi:hypothetical protein
MKCQGAVQFRVTFRVTFGIELGILALVVGVPFQIAILCRRP